MKKDPYDPIYASGDSPTRVAIFREVYGKDYPEEVAPRSYITTPLLARIAKSIGAHPAAMMVDLGCGRGGPGLWVARETGASLVGVDLSPVAIEHACLRARDFGWADQAQFEVADLARLRFPDCSFDAAMSVDVLWMVPHRQDALREVARVVKPGARFVFTDWDRDLARPGTPSPVADYKPLLRNAGFSVETYDELPGEEAKRRAIYERYIAYESALRREMVAEELERVLSEARANLGLLDGVDYLAHSRRIFVVAVRSQGK